MNPNSNIPSDMNQRSPSSYTDLSELDVRTFNEINEARLTAIKKGLQFKRLKAKRKPDSSEDESLASSLSDKLSITDCETSMSSSTSGISGAHEIRRTCAGTSADQTTCFCTLCSYKFDNQQVVCLSFNPACNHVFHATCMVSVLMKDHDHNKCPICDQWYLLTG